MSQNSVPPSPTQGLTNQATIDFLEGLGLPLDQLWLAWSITHANGDPGWRAARYSRAVVAAMPVNQRHHVSSGLYPPGLSSRKDKDLLGVFSVCADDVGIPGSVGPNGEPLSFVDIDLFHCGLLPPWTWLMETYIENHQAVWQFDPVLTPAEADIVIETLKRKLPNGVVHSAGQYMRTPTGINSKRGGVSFLTKLKDSSGPKYTFASFMALITPLPDIAPAAPARGKGGWGEQWPLDVIRKVVFDFLPNDGTYAHHDDWLRVGCAIKGAGGDDAYDIWEDWCSQQAQESRSAEKTWEDIGEAKSSGSTLRKEVEKRYGKDSKEYAEVQSMRAKADFGVVPGAAGVPNAGPVKFDLSDWNPWDKAGGPAFPVDTLPDTMRDWAVASARATGTDVSAFVMAGFAGLSAVLDHRTRLKPKAKTPYTVSPLIWAMLVGDPGTKKSVPIKEMKDVLGALDKRDHLTREAKIAFAMNPPPPAKTIPRKEAEAKVPHARVRVIYDTTTESLCDVLTHQDCGVGLLQDELGGWIGSMDKYGGGGKGPAQNRAVWIKAHDGGTYGQNRISVPGGKRSVGNLSCTILGAIQPKYIADLGQLDHDGLLQRFLPTMMSPSMPDLDVDVPDDFHRLIEAVDRLSPETYALDAGARDIRKAFADEMSGLSGTTVPSASFGSFLAKQERTLNVLALILHIIDEVEGRGNPFAEIPAATMQRAETIMRKFVIPHAWVFYWAINTAWGDEVQNFAAAFVELAKEGRDRVTKRDIDHKCRASRGMNLRSLQDALLPFQANGWVAPEEMGFQNHAWLVNKTLVTKFGAEAALHREMREKLLRKIMGETQKL